MRRASPASGRGVSRRAGRGVGVANPGLPPWATLFRRFAAWPLVAATPRCERISLVSCCAHRSIRAFVRPKKILLRRPAWRDSSEWRAACGAPWNRFFSQLLSLRARRKPFSGGAQHHIGEYCFRGRRKKKARRWAGLGKGENFDYLFFFAAFFFAGISFSMTSSSKFREQRSARPIGVRVSVDTRYSIL
jgi:hypothetical protein